MFRNNIGTKIFAAFAVLVATSAFMPAVPAHGSAPFTFGAGTVNCYIGTFGWHKMTAGSTFSTTLDITSGTWHGGYCSVAPDASGNCPGSGTITATISGTGSTVSGTWSFTIGSTTCVVPASYTPTGGSMSQSSSP